jgi:hypothetical protein
MITLNVFLFSPCILCTILSYYKSGRVCVLLQLICLWKGVYLSCPDVPFSTGQSRFSFTCPVVPTNSLGTPICPVLVFLLKNILNKHVWMEKTLKYYSVLS